MSITSGLSFLLESDNINSKDCPLILFSQGFVCHQDIVINTNLEPLNSRIFYSTKRARVYFFSIPRL